MKYSFFHRTCWRLRGLGRRQRPGKQCAANCRARRPPLFAAIERAVFAACGIKRGGGRRAAKAATVRRFRCCGSAIRTKFDCARLAMQLGGGCGGLRPPAAQQPERTFQTVASARLSPPFAETKKGRTEDFFKKNSIVMVEFEKITIFALRKVRDVAQPG